MFFLFFTFTNIILLMYLIHLVLVLSLLSMFFCLFFPYQLATLDKYCNVRMFLAFNLFLLLSSFLFLDNKDRFCFTLFFNKILR